MRNFWFYGMDYDYYFETSDMENMRNEFDVTKDAS